VTICNQLPIRRLDTWRRRARDHSTRHRTLGLPTYKRSIVTKSLSPAVSEILGPNHIGVTTLTFQGHVTSSVTWPLDSGWVISCWWSFGPKSLSLTVFEIFRPKQHVLIDTILNRHCAWFSHCSNNADGAAMINIVTKAFTALMQSEGFRKYELLISNITQSSILIYVVKSGWVHCLYRIAVCTAFIFILYIKDMTLVGRNTVFLMRN